MIAAGERQRNLFYAAFEREDITKMADADLRGLDRLLDDADMIEPVRVAQATRSPRSRTRGRTTLLAPDQLLRLIVLKHLRGLSFRALEREVRGSLAYRWFTRLDAQRIPAFETVCRNTALLGEALVRQIHDRVVELARQGGLAAGKKLRTDTTVVESNIHPPSDSTLLADSIRVLTRSLKRLSLPFRVTDHRRAVTRRVLEIHRAARVAGKVGADRRRNSYRKLLKLARAVSNKAERACAMSETGGFAGASKASTVEVSKLHRFVGLARKVIAQNLGKNPRSEGLASGSTL